MDEYYKDLKIRYIGESNQYIKHGDVGVITRAY